MPGGYELTDPSAVYHQGKSIAVSESDARSAGQALVDALSEVALGTDHDAGALASRIIEFQTDCADSRNRFANEVSELGENTAAGASTGVETNNDGTYAANSNTSLARDVTTQMCRAPQY